MVDGDDGVGGCEEDSVHGIVAVVVVVVVFDEGVVVVVVVVVVVIVVVVAVRSRLWRMSVVVVFDGEDWGGGEWS